MPEEGEYPINGEPTLAPDEEPEIDVDSSPTPMPTAAPSSYETTTNYSGNSTTLGELEVEYPAVMQPQTSNTVIASVYIPDALVSADVTRYERVSISEERQLDAGDLVTYVATVLLAGSIRAEINSPTLEFEAA